MGPSKFSNNKESSYNSHNKHNRKYSRSPSKKNFQKYNNRTYLQEYVHVDNLSRNVTENHLKEIFRK